jgi:GT2 family glycosyltransferase
MEGIETDAPLCSVVVPTRQRPEQLMRCLDALARLDYPRDRLEVIVVDDGGGASLESLLAPLRDRLQLKLVPQEHAGPAAARNAGAAHARGSLLAFTDDDCLPDRLWLRELATRHVEHPGRILGGRTVNALTGNRYSTTSELVLAVGYAQNNPDPDAARFFASNNLAVPATEFDAIAGFDPDFRTSEDRDLCDRSLARGATLSYVPQAVVRHAHRLTFRSFCRQHFRNGRGLWLFHRAHVRREGRRVAVEPGYYLRLLRAARELGAGFDSLALPVLVIVCQLANLAGFLWEWTSHWWSRD